MAETESGKDGGRQIADEYLTVAHSIVEAFEPFQADDGTILDPVFGTEKQYATPAFACSAALVATCLSSLSGPARRRLLSAAIRAVDSAVANLCGGLCDGHPDFFTILVVYALNALGPHVADHRLEGWRRALSSLDPEQRYRVVVSKSPEKIHNWNVVALAGEFHRWKAGLCDSLEWVERYLALQVERFTEEGLYEDPGAPLAYDLFARQFIADMLAQGYQGAFAARLAELMDRSARLTLALQSPCGEWPTGGRSSQHQWNEAQLALFLEATARRWAQEAVSSRSEDAAVEEVARCREGGRRALESVRRWLRPAGDLWIVKNRYPPQVRHGFEPYSFHSQYNLLVAALLSIAAAHAQANPLAERAERSRIPPTGSSGSPGAPSTGPGALREGRSRWVSPLSRSAAPGAPSVAVLGPPFRKVALASSGYYALVNTGANEGYDPSGLVRVHRAGCPSNLLFSGGAVEKPRYEVTEPGHRVGGSRCEAGPAPGGKGRSSASGPWTEPAGGNLSACAWWKEEEGWTGIAGLWGARLQAEVVRARAAPSRPGRSGALGGAASAADPGETAAVLIRWWSGRRPLVETEYRVGPEGVTITERALEIPRPFRVTVPFLVFDGEVEAVWRVRGNLLRVERDGARATVELLNSGEGDGGDPQGGPGGGWRVSEARHPSRNGVLRHVWTESEGEIIRYRIEMRGPQSSTERR